MQRGLEHGMVGLAGLHEQVPVGLSPAHHPAGQREHRQGLLGRPVAGRGQLLVEVEERDGVGRRDPVQDGLRADHHPGAGITVLRRRR